MRRYLLSLCCRAYVVVPVEVTAHLLVRGTGAISTSIVDSMPGFRHQALTTEVDVADAYCLGCGSEVDVEALTKEEA